MAGILVLSDVGLTLAHTHLYQANAARQFEQALKRTPGVVPVLAEANRTRDGDVAIPPNEGAPLGRIEIGRIGLGAMILQGDDPRTLRLGVGHIPGTALPGQPGNVAIAGHRDTFFRGLRKLQKGDEITLVTLNGTDRYRVDSLRVVAPQDIEVLDHSNTSILTLVTCYPFYFVGPAPHRFIVRASKIPEAAPPS